MTDASDQIATSLKSISVEQLFDRFNYKVPMEFNSDAASGLVIITAPNGYGKSTILKLLNDVANGDYAALSQTVFRRFVIETAESIALVVERTAEAGEQLNPGTAFAPKFNLQFSIVDTESGATIKGPFDAELRATIDDDDDRHFRRNMPTSVDRILPYLRRVAPNVWRDVRNNAILNQAEVARLLDDKGIGGRGLRVGEPIWLTNFQKGLKILYISANRLRVDSDSRGPGRSGGSGIVENWALRVRDRIRDAIRSYADNGRRLEQNFPTRIIAALRAKTKVAQEEVSKLIGDVRALEARYQKLGLVSGGQTAEIDGNIAESAALLVLKTYLEDIEAKFKELDEPAERLEIYVETINSMLLFKKLKLSADIGFEIAGDKGGAVPLAALSSGEQHLIVLLGELIFGSSAGTVILLDEPEISFHPEWQEKFPRVLAKIIEINRCSIVMATHSPTLIQDNWELVVELEDQVS
jgi:energy-coupling factor transporter ATP-binding protein EcfA2